MQTKETYLQAKTLSFAMNPTVKSRGVALITVMLFLIALTGLAVWTARQSLMGEGMARNQLDRTVATQAAEAALRDAERDLTTLSSSIRTNASCARVGREGPPNVAEFSSDCSMGYCIKDSESEDRKSVV